ncbi:MAG: hypothetical protein ABSD46_02975 [Bacteroidota bacterium]
MSRITERTNVSEIEEVHASLVSLGDLSSYRSSKDTLLDVSSYCPENIMSAINAACNNTESVQSNTVCSPNMLRAIFAKSFSPAIERINTSGLSPLDIKKVALISTINMMDFKVTDKGILNEGIKAVVNAGDAKVLNSEMKSFMGNLEVMHTKVFSSNLAQACAKASVTVGFKQVEVKRVDGNLNVIATNEIGQHINTEISIDGANNIVNARTEIIGMRNGTCDPIIKQFNQQLKRMGIKLGSEKTTSTDGNCQLPYSKVIDQEDNDRRKRQERTRKLNTLKQQRIGGR